MSQPLTVTIPHRLGREEAARRLKTGIGRLDTQFGKHFSLLKNDWTGDHLDFHVAALGQSASGAIDVAEDHVRLEVQLPWLLARLTEKAKLLIEKQGHLMLDKK